MQFNSAEQVAIDGSSVGAEKQYVVGECLWAGVTCEACCTPQLRQDRATGEEGAGTEIELGTYTLLRNFSHVSHRSQSRSLVASHPYVPVTGVPLSSGRLNTHASSLGLCAVWWWQAQGGGGGGGERLSMARTVVKVVASV